jgi:hypothetical protein
VTHYLETKFLKKNLKTLIFLVKKKKKAVRKKMLEKKRPPKCPVHIRTKMDNLIIHDVSPII